MRVGDLGAIITKDIIINIIVCSRNIFNIIDGTYARDMTVIITKDIIGATNKIMRIAIMRAGYLVANITKDIFVCSRNIIDSIDGTSIAIMRVWDLAAIITSNWVMVVICRCDDNISSLIS